jgi:hypothetical protein
MLLITTTTLSFRLLLVQYLLVWIVTGDCKNPNNSVSPASPVSPATDSIYDTAANSLTR